MSPNQTDAQARCEAFNAKYPTDSFFTCESYREGEMFKVYNRAFVEDDEAYLWFWKNTGPEMVKQPIHLLQPYLPASEVAALKKQLAEAKAEIECRDKIIEDFKRLLTKSTGQTEEAHTLLKEAIKAMKGASHE